jgi:hypothetical protein
MSLAKSTSISVDEEKEKVKEDFSILETIETDCVLISILGRCF